MTLVMARPASSSIARDGMVSHRFVKVSPKTMTPVFNTVVVSIIVACIAGFVPSDYLWDSVSFGTLVAFSLVAISIIVLRRRGPTWSVPSRCRSTRWCRS